MMRPLSLALLLAACSQQAESDGDRAPPPIAGPIAIADRDADEPAVTRLAAGRASYNVHCAVCHGIEGAGDGPVISRGFAEPAPFSSQNSGNAARTVHIITNGYGAMQPQADAIPVEERWAIARYVESLAK